MRHDKYLSLADARGRVYCCVFSRCPAYSESFGNEFQPHLQSPAADDVNRADWLYLRSALIK